jgi:HAD superfamily hydrolase (TIGR01549 family)
VEFDRPQIDFILEGLRRAFSGLVGPIELETLRRHMDDVCTLPFRGEPPELRELTPHSQMEILLRNGWGSDAALDSGVVAECNRVLQDLFVEAIAIEPAVRSFLQEMRRAVKVGLVSNYPCGGAIRRALEKIDIAGLLDPVVISGEVGYVKPHSLPFSTALASLGLAPDQVLFVGDRWDADMVGARNAGMKTCHHLGFTSDRGQEERYAAYEPDYKITCLEELRGIVMP